MTAILREDAAPLAESGRAIPPGLARIVSHCLEKKPEQRFQSARDLAFDLANLSGSSAAGQGFLATSSRSRLWAWSAAGLSVLALVGLAYRAGRGAAARQPTGAPGLHFMQVTDLSGIESKPSLSPDGKTVAFVSRADGDFDVYVQRVGGHNPINLTPDCSKDDSGPAFSPDAERIAFHSECEGGGLFVMGATGESRRKLADAGHDPSWSPDGGKLVVASEALINPLARRGQSIVSVLDLASGTSRRLIEQDAVQPTWSPDGRRIAFWGLRGGMGGGGTRDIWTVAAEGGEPVDVTNDPHIDWNPAWSADGRHLYFGSGRGGTLNLWRVAIDAATGRTTGPPEAVTTPSRKIFSFSLSRDGGRLAFESRDDRSALYRVALDPEHGRLAGTPQIVLGGSRDIASLALSPNGEWVAFTSSGLQENVFVVRLDGTGYRQLTDDSFRNRGPGWSADGSVIGFYSNRSGRYEVWTMRPDGSGLTQLTETKVGTQWYPEWSFDGSRIVIAGVPMTRVARSREADRRAGRARAAAPAGRHELPRGDLVGRRQAHRRHGGAARRQLGRDMAVSPRLGPLRAGFHQRAHSAPSRGRAAPRLQRRGTAPLPGHGERALGGAPLHRLVEPGQQPGVQGHARRPPDRLRARRARGRHLADEPGVIGAFLVARPTS